MSCRYCDSPVSSLSGSSSYLRRSRGSNYPTCGRCSQKQYQGCNRRCACSSGCVLDSFHLGPCLCLKAECASRKSFPCAQDMCSICHTDVLFTDNITRTRCDHFFHSECLVNWVKSKWNGNIVGLGWTECPLCRDPLMLPFNSLSHPFCNEYIEAFDFRKEVSERCKNIVLSDVELNTERQAARKSPDEFWPDAFRKLNFFSCHRCHSLYYGGKKECGHNEEINQIDAKEFTCHSCRGCPKHGLEGLTFKCRHCCNVASYFCFGHTHFCHSCHTKAVDIQSEGGERNRIISAIKVCVGPGKCPLDCKHPPNGEEFQIGSCRLCAQEEGEAASVPSPSPVVPAPSPLVLPSSSSSSSSAIPPLPRSSSDGPPPPPPLPVLPPVPDFSSSLAVPKPKNVVRRRDLVDKLDNLSLSGSAASSSPSSSSASGSKVINVLMSFCN